MGDPAGIGPEVLAGALPAFTASDLLLVGDEAVWQRALVGLHLSVPLRPARRPEPVTAEGIPFLEIPAVEGWQPGRVSPAAGKSAAQWLEQAVRLALEGAADGVVFAPLNKEAIIRAGYPVRDEYELCASLAGVSEFAEMNAIPHPAGRGLLWVARVTGHVAVREISPSLSVERVLRTIRMAQQIAGDTSVDHDRAGGTAPRIGVAALNPHAGEGGIIGDEESRAIAPALRAAAAEGINVSGPHPADQIFRLARSGRFDAVVAMYHDQAQIATKLLGFARGVSVGVGYPFVLTTPSHGTAFDIVGRGVADTGPMGAALALAERLVHGRSRDVSAARGATPP